MRCYNPVEMSIHKHKVVTTVYCLGQSEMVMLKG
jgi:hypothetical protein